MKNYLIATEGNHYTAMYALNGFSGTVNRKITDLAGVGVRDILVNRTFNSSNPITFGTPPSFTLTETGEYYIEFQATHNSAFAFIPGNPHLAATFISIIQMARTVTLTARDQTLAYRYGFNTQMLDNNLAGMGNHLTAQYWEYDPRYGRRWNLDPVRQYYISQYATFGNNPIRFTDWLGDRPSPVYDKYLIWGWRVDSWFGPRKSKEKNSSRYHKGIDINFNGGGNTDRGAPILATHSGNAKIDNNPSGAEGRMVIITSEDNNFRTKYMHLQCISVENGPVSESQQIGEMEGSAFGSESGRTSHLHYQIEKFNSETNTWKPIDPTDGKGNSKYNLVDPQEWVQKKIPKFMPTENVMPADNTRVNVITPMDTPKSDQPKQLEK